MNFKKILFIAGCGLALSLGKMNAQSAVFNYSSNATQTWTVPCGVTTVTLNLWGAGGAGGHQTGYTDAWCGGSGAYMEGTLSGLTAGQTLILYVPQGGEYYTSNPYAPGGWPGGGNAGADVNFSEWGGAGGGYAAVQIGATYYAVAGAGGGGGSTAYGGTAYGGGGGNPNSTITVGTLGVNGGPGLIGSGGAGGAGGILAGNPGTALTGGLAEAQSPNGEYGGGGGGAGWYGGGGGGDEGNAGGGGSSFPNGSFSSAGVTFTVISNLAGTTNSATSGSAVAQGGPPAGIGSGNIAGAGGNGYIHILWTLPTALVVSANTSTNETCNGGNSGSASSTVSGGTVPYTYAWTGGGTNATVSGLTAGSYTVTVTDKCGNTGSASVSITQPTAIVATITSTNVTCNGGDTATASSTVTGGTGAYTYSWTGGGTNAAITGLTAGTYNLNVQDANGCTGSATVTITQPTMLVVSDSTTANVWCHGDSSGSASSKVSGGTMPYMYLWTGGGTTDTAVGLKAGTYTLTVQDANGCTGTAMVTITQPSALSIVKHATADNGSGNGAAWVNVSGGVSPYTYAWAGGNTTDSISGKTKGTYCCTVKDANGCMDSVCIYIASTAGVDGITSNGGQIMVYPNPNNGQFTIQSSLNAVSIVEVYNVLGEKVFSGNLNAGNNTINMSNQSNGIYLYRVMSESGTLISEGKISVQK